MAKVKKLNELKKILDRLKKEGKKIVFTNGCFDLIHPGHIKVLKEAKRKGDILVVGLNSDKSVRKIKGPQRPILDEKTRARVVSALEDVDFVVIFNQPTPLNLINTIKPHCLVKGSDLKKKDIVGRDLVKKVFTVKILKGYSTTEIVNKIKRSGN